MMQLASDSQQGIILWPESSCLLTQLSKQLLANHRDHLAKVFLVLPTKRQARYFLAMLKDIAPECLSPQIFTLDSFVDRCCEIFHGRQASTWDSVQVGERAARMVLAQELSEDTFKHLHRGHEGELAHLFAMLEEYSLADCAFERLAEALQHDLRSSPRRLTVLQERFAELERLYQRYASRLSSAQRSSAQRLQAEKSALVAQALYAACDDELPWHTLYFACFTTVKAYYLPVLKHLASLASVRFFLSTPPQVFSQCNPMAALIAALETEAFQIPEPQLTQATHCSIHRFSSRIEEVAYVFDSVRALIAAGTQASQIGILVCNEQEYGKLLATFARLSGLDVNLAIAFSLAESSIGRHMIALIRWLKKHARLRDQDAPQSLGLWLEEFKQQASLWLPHEDKEEEEASDTSSDDASCHELARLWHDLAEASELCTSALRYSEFLNLVQQQIVAARYRVIGFPLQGVQIISLAESRYIPFRYAFVLGCLEGNFPRALSRELVVSSSYREKIGLPTWAYVEALEDTTFHLLKSRTEHLVLTYPGFASNQPTVRSRFVEQLERDPTVEVYDHGSASYSRRFFASSSLPEQMEARRTKYPESLSKAAQVGRFPADCEPLLTSISATQLEKLLQCPYHFLLSSLGIRETREEDEFDARREGEVLHSIVEGFFAGMVNGRRVLPALSPRELRTKTSIELHQRLQYLSELLFPRSEQASPLYYHVLHHAWPRFIEQIQASGDDRTEQILNEYSFGEQPYPQLPRINFDLGEKTISIHIRGTIDRLDIGKDGFRINDYKRRTLPRPSEVERADAPQLPLYALALSQVPGAEERFSLQRASIHYWSLLDGKSGGRMPDVNKSVEQLKKRWQQRLTQVLVDGQPFAPEPGPSCTFCGYSGICRKGRRDRRVE